MLIKNSRSRCKLPVNCIIITIIVYCLIACSVLLSSQKRRYEQNKNLDKLYTSAQIVVQQKNISSTLEQTEGQQNISPGLNQIGSQQNISPGLNQIGSQQNISPGLNQIGSQQNISSGLNQTGSQQNISSGLNQTGSQQNISSTLEIIKIQRNISKPIFQLNSTHLWNMRLADENYFRLVNLLPCRTAEYGTGIEPLDKIDSCNRSPANEFSINTSINAQKWIFEHQNPLNCTDKQYAVIRNIAWSGFGSTLHQVAWAFGRALSQGRIAIYDVPGKWVFGTCESSTPDCVFLPISNCSDAFTFNINTTVYIDANTNRFPESIPMVFRQRTFTWYRSQLLFYLLRYNNETLSYVQRKIAESFVPPSIEVHNPFIAVYVRRSDKVASKEMKQSYALKEYFDLFDNDAMKGNINTIYLNSEDPIAFIEFTELNQKMSNRYKLLTISVEKNLTFGIISSMSNVSRHRVTLDFLTDLYIEVHADLHSGTLTSNYCRLVDALKLVLGKTMPFYTPENFYCVDS